MPEGATAEVKPLSFYYDEYDYYAALGYERMAKTDTRAKYRAASTTEVEANQRCYGCRFYQWGTCNLVEGTVEANNLCDLFTPEPQLYPMDMADVVRKGKPISLFMETKAFATKSFVDGVAPEWIHYWPAPGRFNHPTYGEIVITEDRNRRIVDNFQKAVYQESLPLDCEHDLVTSGAVGWIEEMRLASDGSIEARVNWNDRGKQLLAEDRFRYFSPSIITNWPHTVTGELIPDVAVGGAICTQPYFKESWLRPLVATESGEMFTYERPHRTESNVKPIREVRITTMEPHVRQEGQRMSGTENPGATGTGVVQFSDTEVAAFREFQTKGGLAKFAELEAANAEADKRLKALEASNRESRFRSLIRGVSTEVFTDGTSREKRGKEWLGEVKDHLVVMNTLADAHGEDSDQFKAYVRTHQVAAEAGNGRVFSEIGSGDPGQEDTATDQFTGLVTEARKADTKLTFADAVKQVAKEHPGLYEDYRQENTQRV